MPLRRWLKTAFLNVIHRYQIDVRSDVPCVLGQKLGMVLRIVHAVDHYIFKRYPAAGLLIIAAAALHELIHSSAVV